MKLIRTMSLLALAALPGMAQSPFEVNAGALLTAGNMRRMVTGNDLTGSAISFAGRFEIKPGTDHRFHFGLLGVKFKTGSGLEGAAPKHLHFGYDIVHQLSPKTTFFGGLTGTKWKQDEAKATDPLFKDQPTSSNLNASGDNRPRGVKLGARIGLQFAHTAHLSTVVSFTHSEFNKKFNPGWFNVGITWRF